MLRPDLRDQQMERDSKKGCLIFVGMIAAFLVIWKVMGGDAPPAKVPQEAQIAAANEIRKDFGVRGLANDQTDQLWSITTAEALSAPNAQTFAESICAIIVKHGAALTTTRVELVHGGSNLADAKCVKG